MRQLLVILVVGLLASRIDCNIYNSWLTTSCSGYNNYAGNVLSVTNGSGVVAVRSNSIPCYSIGPWSNPSLPIEANKTTSFPMTPSEQTGNKTDVCLGSIGLFIDGVFIFNYWDVDKRDAYVYEGVSFDSCWGHNNQDGYHIHVAPVCLIKQLGYSLNDTTRHSPLLGFMLDSYPVYGPFGYSDPTNSSSPLKLLKSSYRNYVYNSSYGDLDQYNGRWTVTPEYPQGTYAYYATYTYTVNSTGYLVATPQYPYLIGPKYFGKVNVRGDCGNNGVVVSTTTTSTKKTTSSTSRTTTKSTATTKSTSRTTTKSTSRVTTKSTSRTTTKSTSRTTTKIVARTSPLTSRLSQSPSRPLMSSSMPPPSFSPNPSGPPPSSLPPSGPPPSSLPPSGPPPSGSPRP